MHTHIYPFIIVNYAGCLHAFAICISLYWLHCCLRARRRCVYASILHFMYRILIIQCMHAHLCCNPCKGIYMNINISLHNFVDLFFKGCVVYTYKHTNMHEWLCALYEYQYFITQLCPLVYKGLGVLHKTGAHPYTGGYVWEVVAV